MTPTSTHRVIVRSVGTAGASLPRVLAGALPIPPEKVARCVYQAPQVLLDGLDEANARTIAELLGGTGLEVEVASSDVALQAGGPDLELAVHVSDPARFREIAAELARFLGCEVARAVELLCATPPVVLGQVSRATARALVERLTPLGAEVDVSEVSSGRYDVFVDETAPTLRARIAALLTASGCEVAPEGPLVALGISREDAGRLWKRVGQEPKWRLLDQAFARFDLVLEAAPDTDEAVRAIVEVSGMPAGLVPKVRARLPVVLCEALPASKVRDALERLSAAEVVVSAKLITLTLWDVVVSEARDVAAATEVVTRILGRDRGEVLAGLRRLPARFVAAAPLVRARWLVHELEQAGAHATLEAR